MCMCTLVHCCFSSDPKLALTSADVSIEHCAKEILAQFLKEKLTISDFK